jgi:RNA polymerase sigma-70 factor (ECF subfamily)
LSDFPLRSGSIPHLPVDEEGLAIEACLAGEESAYVHVYNRYAGAIYRLCFGLLQHKEDSEEVLQDTFEYAFRRLENFDDARAGFKTWLYQIAISRCRNKRRRKVLFTISISQLFNEQVIDLGSSTPSETAELSERQEMVWNGLRQLSPKLRETAILRYYEGFTYREIGQILSIPEKTAESRMRLAHKALKENLSDQYFGDDIDQEK